jgi:hypothetical protein
MAIDSTRRGDLSVGMPDLVPGQEPVKRWPLVKQVFWVIRQ